MCVCVCLCMCMMSFISLVLVLWMHLIVLSCFFFSLWYTYWVQCSANSAVRFNKSIDWLIDWLIQWLIDLLINWTDCLIGVNKLNPCQIIGNEIAKLESNWNRWQIEKNWNVVIEICHCFAYLSIIVNRKWIIRYSIFDIRYRYYYIFDKFIVYR